MGDTLQAVMFGGSSGEEAAKDAQEKIEAYNNVQKKAFVDWVNSTKTEQTKADRITKIIIMAMNGVIGYI